MNNLFRKGLWFAESNDDADGLEDDEELEEEELEDEEEELEGESDDEVAQLKAELEETQKKLRKANRESRGRRHAIRDLEAQLEALKSEAGDEEDEGEEDNGAANAELERLRAENRMYKLEQAIAVGLAKTKIQFVSDQARNDAIRYVLTEFEDDDEIDEEDLKDAMKDLAKVRPYLFGAAKQRETGNADGRSRGSGEFKLTEDEEELVANQFNIRPL